MTAPHSDAAFMSLAPLRISEVVLKTRRFDEMKRWYTRLVGVAPFFERTPPPGQPVSDLGRASDRKVAFIRLHLDHPYAQVLGLFEVPDLEGEPRLEPGLDHLQLRNANLSELVTRYDLLKARGERPFRTANHGPGTSFYYKDPDGNRVELSASNFETEAEYLAYFQSDSYRRNPSGIEIDVEAFIARYRAGTPRQELVAID